MYSTEARQKYAALYKEAVEKLASLFGIELTQKEKKNETPSQYK
jgi:hypothetical protein